MLAVFILLMTASSNIPGLAHCESAIPAETPHHPDPFDARPCSEPKQLAVLPLPITVKSRDDEEDENKVGNQTRLSMPAPRIRGH